MQKYYKKTGKIKTVDSKIMCSQEWRQSKTTAGGNTEIINHWYIHTFGPEMLPGATNLQLAKSSNSQNQMS